MAPQYAGKNPSNLDGIMAHWANPGMLGGTPGNRTNPSKLHRIPVRWMKPQDAGKNPSMLQTEF